MAQSVESFNCTPFERTRKTVWHLQQMKEKGEKISMVGTTFLHPFITMWCEYSGVDLVRYLAPGENCKTRASRMEEWTRMQRQFAPNICLNAWMEPGTWGNIDTAVDNASVLIQEGADSVLCMGITNDKLKAMADNYIAVFGHVGLLSGWQTTRVGGYKRVGKTAEDALHIFRMAYEYQENGMVGMTIEMTPIEVTDAIASKLRVPVIEVAGGGYADGSELVVLDLLGFTPADSMAKHSKCYADLMGTSMKAFGEFNKEVKSMEYPVPDQHGWHMDAKELDKFMTAIEK